MHPAWFSLLKKKKRTAHAQVAGVVSLFIEEQQRSLIFWDGIAQLMLSPACSFCVDLSGFCYNEVCFGEHFACCRLSASSPALPWRADSGQEWVSVLSAGAYTAYPDVQHKPSSSLVPERVTG